MSIRSFSQLIICCSFGGLSNKSFSRSDLTFDDFYEDFYYKGKKHGALTVSVEKTAKDIHEDIQSRSNSGPIPIECRWNNQMDLLAKGENNVLRNSLLRNELSFV